LSAGCSCSAIRLSLTGKARLKKIIFFTLILSLFILQSCDDFLLKKTVSIERLRGGLSYDPSDLSLSGDLTYDIRNNQTFALNEIYLVSHSSLTVENVAFRGDNIRFEQGIAYGLGIYRIKIPVLSSGEKAKITIRFHLNGPINAERFLLTKDRVYLDASKIWLPVPFAEIPRCRFSLSVRTPDDYYSVLGAAIKNETVKNGKRTIVWESETDDVLKTGNLFIGKLERKNQGNIYLYTANTKHADAIIDYASRSVSLLSNQMGEYPFSQLHIVNEILYPDLNEFLAGDASANMLMIYPDPNWTDDASLDDSLLPDVPRTSGWAAYELIGHETSHAYIRGILRFEDSSIIESEALTEFTGLELIQQTNDFIYRKFIQRNRVELINLFLQERKSDEVIRYIYGVNCFDSAFSMTGTNYFNYLKLLIDKYRYTEIQPDELLQTAIEKTNWLISEDERELFMEKGALPEALKLLKKQELYNIALSFTNVLITNILNRRRITEVRKNLLIDNGFPLDVDALIIADYPAKTTTNYIKLYKDSSTNWIFEKEPLTVEILSRYSGLENKLSDNRIYFSGENPMNGIIDGLNQYYAGKNLPKNIEVEDSTNSPAGFKNLSRDRLKSLSINSNVTFELDNMAENDQIFALEAYKSISGTVFSYVIIKGRKDNKKYIINGILDPYL
jgi:hypothetical protein